MRFNSAILSQARGSMGGLTATKGAAQQFLRAKVAPVKRATKTQQVQRAKQTLLAQQWRTLTPAQRNAWAAYAATLTLHNALGTAYRPSGFQFFVSCNRNLSLTMRGVILQPPAHPTPILPVAVPTLTATLTHGAAFSLIATQAAGWTTAVNELAVFLTPGLSPGLASPPRSQFRWIGSRTNIIGGNLFLTTVFNNLFHTAALGQMIGLKFFYVEPGFGIVGPTTTISTIVTGT